MGKSRVRYEIIRGCTMCMTCLNECPENAIVMTEETAKVNEEKCIACGVCYDNCPYEAIVKTEEEQEVKDAGA